MKVILLEDDTVYEYLMQDLKKKIKEAIKEAVLELKDKTENSEQASWISGLSAMKILGCKRDKLRILRENEDVKTTCYGRKVLYYRPSLYSFLEKHVEKY